MKKLYIVGAGGFGREVAGIVQECRGCGDEFELAGFIDDRAAALDAFPNYPPIAGGMDRAPRPDELYFCALGDVKARRACVERLRAAGAQFARLIDRRATIGYNVQIGGGCLVRAGAVLAADVELGAHSCVFDGAFVGHDCRIGEFCHLSAQTFLGGGVQLGSGVTLHPGARVVPGRRLGDGVTVGIASAVLRNLPAGVTVFGVPALEC